MQQWVQIYSEGKFLFLLILASFDFCAVSTIYPKALGRSENLETRFLPLQNIIFTANNNNYEFYEIIKSWLFVGQLHKKSSC